MGVNNKTMLKAFDMVFVLAQKSYEGYDYYDFFEQAYERLKGAPFYSNLSSEKEVRIFYGKKIIFFVTHNLITFELISYSVFDVLGKLIRCIFTRCCSTLCHGP